MRPRFSLPAMLTFCALCCAAGPSAANVVPISGSFTDRANTALISSNGYDDLGAAQFGSDDAAVLNIAVYAISVTTAGAVQFTSTGYGANRTTHGIEPYVTLFSGHGPQAVFFDSTYSNPDYDPDFTESLAVGDYLFAISVYANMSFAEQDLDPPTVPVGGTLSEGYTTLVDTDRLHDGSYAFNVGSDAATFTIAPATGIIGGGTGPGGPTDPGGPTTPGGTVPEPDAFALMAIGSAVLVNRRRVCVRHASRRPYAGSCHSLTARRA